MRRPNRIIEIFSMSVLDMFASALGAFIMISVILFPYFNRYQQLQQMKREIAKTTDEIRKTSEQLQKSEEVTQRQEEQINKGSEARTALVACRQTKAKCDAKVTKVFLVVGMEWDDQCDVDLYVTDPNGRTFSWKKPADRQSKAELSIDMRYGPGIELWQDPQAESGDYRVQYDISGVCPALALGQVTDQVAVKGWIVDRNGGMRTLKERILTPTRRNVDAATIHVSADGSTNVPRGLE